MRESFQTRNTVGRELHSFSRDTYRLEYLARLGLLDGLLDDLDGQVDEQSSVAPEELTRLETLNRLYDHILEELEVKVTVLSSAVKDLPPCETMEGFDSKQAHNIQNITLLSRVSDADFTQLVADIDTLFRENKRNLDRTLESLFEPIDHSDALHPELRFQSVSSSHLALRSWHPRDYEYYLQKLRDGLKLLEAAGIKLSIDALLADEQRLDQLRAVNQTNIIKDLLSMRVTLLALHIILVKGLQRHAHWLDETLNAVSTSSQGIQHQLNPLFRYIKAETAGHRIDISIPKLERGQLLDISILNEQASLMSDSLKIMKSISKRLLNGDLDVDPIPSMVRTSEEALRSSALSLSNILMNVQTEAGRVRLLVADRGQK